MIGNIMPREKIHKNASARSIAYRHRRQLGMKRVEIWLSTENLEKLDKMASEPKESRTTVIAALLNRVPGDVSSQTTQDRLPKPMPGETAITFAKRLQDGGMAPGLIASHLNVAGFSTMSGRGLWDNMKVHNLFSDKQKTGARSQRKKEIEGQLTLNPEGEE